MVVEHHLHAPCPQPSVCDIGKRKHTGQRLLLAAGLLLLVVVVAVLELLLFDGVAGSPDRDSDRHAVCSPLTSSSPSPPL